jgi:hypothetical protein
VLYGGLIKRNLFAALTATTFLIVSCGGGTDPAEAYIEIANKANCGLADVAAWYESDEALAIEGNEDFEPLVSKFQSLHAGAAAALKTGMEEMASVEWPENVADDVDVFLIDLGNAVSWMEELSNAETLDDVVEISESLNEPDLDSSEVIESKLGVTEDQLADPDDIDELTAFCS